MIRVEVEFRCLNCGNRVEKDILPMKHAVLGTIPAVNRDSTCCENPEYEDSEGVHRRKHQESYREFLASFA